MNEDLQPGRDRERLAQAVLALEGLPPVDRARALERLWRGRRVVGRPVVDGLQPGPEGGTPSLAALPVPWRPSPRAVLVDPGLCLLPTRAAELPRAHLGREALQRLLRLAVRGGVEVFSLWLTPQGADLPALQAEVLLQARQAGAGRLSLEVQHWPHATPAGGPGPAGVRLAEGAAWLLGAAAGLLLPAGLVAALPPSGGPPAGQGLEDPVRVPLLRHFGLPPH